MSRIGKKPIQLPDTVQVTFVNNTIQISGPKGSLERTIHPNVEIVKTDSILNVTTDYSNQKNVALQGLYRALLANMVVGVSSGYEKQLVLAGIGYRAEMKGKTLVLNVGYSKPVEFEIPPGIEAAVDNNTRIVLKGINKEELGQTAANIRFIRPPEPYKGKGIMYATERIVRKAGKTAGKN
jgi:large subunit ribosomal protein L6